MPDQPSMPPTTTQEDKVAAGQRRINLIWETTQAMIAVSVVVATMITAIYGYTAMSKGEIPNIIATAFGTVVGFYFGRTNHSRIGGVPPQTFGR